jgi:hypothetical protein
MSDEKEKTLCALSEEGFIDKNPKRFKKLIQPAKYYCQNCGRSAVKAQNLCNPEKI